VDDSHRDYSPRLVAIACTHDCLSGLLRLSEVTIRRIMRHTMPQHEHTELIERGTWTPTQRK
jgi:hypothetical protein